MPDATPVEDGYGKAGAPSLLNEIVYEFLKAFQVQTDHPFINLQDQPSRVPRPT
jgi:hypothetical protein